MKPAKVLFHPEGDAPTVWQVEGLRLRDRLGEPYEAEVRLRSSDAGVEPSALLGASVELVIERGTLQQGVGGIVERVLEGHKDRDFLYVTVRVVPALMALAHRRNSRIFQEMSIPEILAQVLGEGLGPYGRRVDLGGITGAHATQEYTVQYREPDLDFVHRLMEEHGIAYRFVTEGGKETMELRDDGQGFGEPSSEGNADGVLAMRPTDGDAGLREDVWSFERASQLRPTVARTAVFDWHVPRPLHDGEDGSTSRLASPDGSALGPEREDYDHADATTGLGYRSDPLDFSAVERQLQLRRELHQRDAVRGSGRSTATQLAPGLRFELLDHPQEELGGEYLVVSVEHRYGTLAGPGAEAGSAYVNDFECIPAAVSWRPERRHPRPRIAGVQTATVVGPPGEEIFTDEHGRIKVQLPWDRGGQFGADASCFMRVVQPWAGNGWGTMFIPRVGMEVTVVFVDGDPDRPIVTGCLYNGVNQPAGGLPGGRVRGGIKSSSTPGGGGFNELRMDDSAGAEEFFLHAQKDMNQQIGNDHTTTIANMQTNTVGADQTQTIAGNQVESIGADQTLSVAANQTVSVSANHSLSVSANQAVSVGGSHSTAITGPSTLDIGGSHTATVKGGVTQTVLGGKTTTVTGPLSHTVNGASTLTHNGGVTETIAGAYALTASAGMALTAPAGLLISAPAGINIIDAASQIELHSIIQTTTGYSSSATGFSLSLVGGALSLTGVRIGVTGVNIAGTGINFSRNAVDFKQDGVEMCNTALKLYTSGFLLNLASLAMFL
ncbi:MAG: type VI secretion system tip protein VgrG [Myxococcales bacterium]|nr:type VI secretion system tip protein VgrG [Myxococcales bacterium]MCB9712705.1 type VI secretion system tip protein VgrG [Myxococcales bacterium]